MGKLNASKWNNRQKILATIAYFDVFDLALSIEDLSKLTLGGRLASGELAGLLQSCDEYCQVIGDEVVLKGREELVRYSSERRQLAANFCEKAKRDAWWLRWVPFVKGLAVCNYLPLGVVDAHSDIDLFVVTDQNRIFTSRVLLTLFTHLLGKRRYGSKIEGRYCLSFYASEADLNFQELLLDQEDIYFVYWVLALMPVYGDKLLWQQLVDENYSWGRMFFPDWRSRFSLPETEEKKGWSRKVVEFLLKGKFGDFCEKKLANFFQGRYQQRKADLPKNASVIVNSRWLKYHNNDRREVFRMEWMAKLKRLGIFEEAGID